jgi:hypothetical protein
MAPGPRAATRLCALASLAWLAGPARASPPPPPPRPTADTVPQLPAIDVSPRPPAGLVLERGAAGDGGPRLEPIGGGRLRHRDPRFTAIVAPDGSVEFRDPTVTANGDILGLDLRSRRLKSGDGGLPRDNFSERALYPHGPPTAAMMVGVGFTFGGLADGPRGKRHASAKLAFLEATEALRLRMAYAWHRDRLREAEAALISRLIQRWRDPSRGLADRKRDLFLAWDECDETSRDSSPLGELRAEAGRSARAKIEALARLLAPPGGPSRYTPAELAALNARRRSVRPFDPYRAP